MSNGKKHKDDRHDEPKEGWLAFIFHLLKEWRQEKNIILTKLIMVLDDLNAAVAANTTALGKNTEAVNAMIIAYQTPNASDDAIIAATTQINANTSVLNANTEALNSALAPVDPPTPTP